MEEVRIYDELIGKTAVSVERFTDEYGEDQLIFTMDDGKIYMFYHGQVCCESVNINDICGDLNDLVGYPILQAEEVIHQDETPDDYPKLDCYESYTWTFYKFATVKGYVTVRWIGRSNGYYSEAVDFKELENASNN